MFEIRTILILSIMVSSCVSSDRGLSINWQVGGELPKDSTAHLGVAGGIIGAIDGKLVVAAGANFPEKAPWEGGKKAYRNEGYIYTLNAGKLDLLKKFDFPYELAYTANASGSDGFYSVGGENAAGSSKMVLKYSFDRQDSLHIERLADLPVALTNAGLAVANGALYIVGGENAEEVSDRVYRLDLGKGDGRWEEFIKLPYPVTHSVVVSDHKDKIWVIGGRKRNLQDKSDMYDRVLQVDILHRAITDLPKLPKPLAAGTGFMTEGGDCVIMGGDDASTFHQVEQLLVDIDRETDPKKKQRLTAEKNMLQSRHPGFSGTVWWLSRDGNVWKQIDSIRGESPVTTTAVLIDDQVIIPSGESKAGVRTGQILVGKISIHSKR